MELTYKDLVDLIKLYEKTYGKEPGCIAIPKLFHESLDKLFNLSPHSLGVVSLMVGNISIYKSSHFAFDDNKIYAGFENHLFSSWVSSTISTHKHEWKQYVGFTNRYRYCECGEKDYKDYRVC